MPPRPSRPGMMVVSAEEALRQALYQGPELLTGFRIYGTKGLVGTSFQRNIFLLEAEKKGARSLRKLVQLLEAEARATVAIELRIIGHAVINKGLFNAAIARRFGFQLRLINNETIELLKVLNT